MIIRVFKNIELLTDIFQEVGMLYIIILFVVMGTVETSFSRESLWKQRQVDFEEYIDQTESRKKEKMQSQKSYVLEKGKREKRKKELKLQFLNQRVFENHQDKAERIFQIYTHPGLFSKSVLKKKFLEQRIKEREQKEVYSIPLEQQLFL